MIKTSRTGAVGALLAVYQDAIRDLQILLESIPDQRLPVIIDEHTQDQNCVSIQSILTHVVCSAYGYATSIHNSRGQHMQRKEKVLRFATRDYLQDLENAYAFTEKVLEGISDPELEEPNNELKMKTAWGQSYDIEQLMEHAIVHILRHKRQIARILATNFH